MKTRFIVLGALLLVGTVGLHAQVSKGITMGSLSKEQQDSLIFAFPACTPGIVYKKDGSSISAKLNYNYYEPQVLFYNDKPAFPEDTLRRLDDLSDVIAIDIDDRRFVPVFGNSLGELILNNKVKLVQTKKVNISEKNVGAYGTGGSTSSSQKVSGFVGNGTSSSSESYSGQSTFTNVNYDFASNSEITVQYTLFLMKDGKVVPLTKKNLLKLFPKAADWIKQYLDEQKPDLENPDDMLLLVNMANANNK